MVWSTWYMLLPVAYMEVIRKDVYKRQVYANSEDEVKKRAVLRRSQEIMKKRWPSPLKIQLHTIYDKLLS